VIKSDGSLWSAGLNNYGELGDGTQSRSYSPELIITNGVKAVSGGDSHALVLKSDGSLWGMGYNAGCIG